jgi:hypothetical protein
VSVNPAHQSGVAGTPCAAAMAVPGEHATPTTLFQGSTSWPCRLSCSRCLALFVLSGLWSTKLLGLFLERRFLIAFHSFAVARVGHLVPAYFVCF